MFPARQRGQRWRKMDPGVDQTVLVFIRESAWPHGLRRLIGAHSRKRGSVLVAPTWFPRSSPASTYQGPFCCCFSASSISLRNASTAGTSGERSASLAR
jgi:hypothetical protein